MQALSCYDNVLAKACEPCCLSTGQCGYQASPRAPSVQRAPLSEAWQQQPTMFRGFEQQAISAAQTNHTHAYVSTPQSRTASATPSPSPKPPCVALYSSFAPGRKFQPVPWSWCHSSGQSGRARQTRPVPRQQQRPLGRQQRLGRCRQQTRWRCRWCGPQGGSAARPGCCGCRLCKRGRRRSRRRRRRSRRAQGVVTKKLRGREALLCKKRSST